MTNIEAINDNQVEKLWETFKKFDEDGNGSISTEELGSVMRSLGQSPSDTELRDLIKEVDIDLSGNIDFEEFKALIVSKEGDHKSRLRLAFSVFDENENGQITTEEMQPVMSQFGLTDEELDEMIKEIDEDGDGSINFEEFCKLVPEESQETTGYKDSPIKSPNKVSSSNITSTATTKLKSEEVTAQPVSKPSIKEQRAGTSPLQMQIGLFRLLQGAAYRCFRESFSANHETHLRVKKLPYRITDFVKFVERAIELYKGLGIVEEAVHPLLDEVVTSITNEYSRLEERIKNWKTIEKTPEMSAEEKAILEARGKSATVKQKFAAGVEFAITLKKKSLSFRDVAEGVLAINELNRLRKMELNEEMAPSSVTSDSQPREYLKKWNRVILSNAAEEVDGSMMPVAYWYEDFMPKLLAAFSITKAVEIPSNTIPNESALNEWYESVKAAGEFKHYGSDVAEGFPNCTPKEKLMLKQAWNLTRHYLNGVQKRREREEFGRESGTLSQYISFIDVYVGRSDVKDAQMRVSFPYYIGPAVWRFFHTSAEIASTKTLEEQKAIVAIFKDFFQLFATMYPCPYCRHHLNMYVVQNKEVDMYPVEYLLLGRDIHLTNFEVSLEAKLSSVVDGASLRLFFWKLHNTVSSSIARSEEWYHKDEKAFYTTRYWPSLDAELARTKVLKQDNISTEFIYRLYSVLRAASRLAGVRTTLQTLVSKGDLQGIQEAVIVAQNHIKDLESAIINSNFLQETYSFNPELVDKAPYFTPEEEAFARSNVFVAD